MKVFKLCNLKNVSDKYKLSLSEFEKDSVKSLTEIKIPEYNEYIGTIYLFINKINNKIYVGLTKCKYYERFGRHFVDTFTKNDKLYLHRSIRKYGWDNFDKVVIWLSDTIYCKDKCEDLTKLLDEKEEYYINLFNSNNQDFGYNLTKGGHNVGDFVHTEEYRIKVSEARKRTNGMKGKTYGKHHLARPIKQYTIDGEFVKEWECVKKAKDEFNINITPHKSLISAGFIWIYSDHPEELEVKLEKIRENKLKKEIKIKEKELYKLQKEKDKKEIKEKNKRKIEEEKEQKRITREKRQEQLRLERLKLKEANKQLKSNKTTPKQSWIQREMTRQLTIERNASLYSNILLLNFFGDIIDTFNNMGHAARMCDCSSDSINNAIRTKTVFLNSIWIKEDDIQNKNEIATFVREHSKIYKRFYKPIYQIFLNGDIIKLWNNYEEILIKYPKSKASINKCLNHKLNFFNNCLWVYEEELTEDLILEKIEKAKSRHKTLVEQVLAGKIKYDENAYLTTKHNTSKKERR